MKAFLEACGLPGPLILGVQGPDDPGVSWIVFDRPFVVIGRDPSADLVLRGPEVSRRHAYLQVVAGRLFCVDLESRTGTRWGDEMGSWGWVSPEVGIRIAGYWIRGRGGAAGDPKVEHCGTADMPVSRAFAQPGLPETTLNILGRSAGASTWRASRALVLIGGSPACRIRLIGGEVAPIHASLLRTPGGVFAIDLLASGGLAVNDRPARCVQLHDGDELAVGTHSLLIRCGSPTAPGLASLAVGRPGPIAPTAAVPAAIGPETVASMLDLTLGEFGEAQRQSVDRLRETLEGVVRALADIHQGQLAAIRDEVAQIRSLVEGQAHLRARAGARPALKVVPSGALCLGRPAPAGGDLHLRLVGGGDDPDAVLARGERGTNAVAPPTRATTGADDLEFQDRVLDRLSQIRAEGQGRWDRLLEKVLGRRS